MIAHIIQWFTEDAAGRGASDAELINKLKQHEEKIKISYGKSSFKKMRNKTRIFSVFGTRPEAIKLSPVILGLQRDSRFESKVIVTGQHRQMLDSVLSIFEIFRTEKAFSELYPKYQWVLV